MKIDQPYLQRSGNIGAIVRSVLAGVPAIGGPLATAWGEWDTRRRFERVEETLRYLARQLSALVDKFDVSAIGDEELQLLEEVLRRVQVEHRDLKRERFAQLLAGTWTSERHRPYEERMRHIRALEEFADLHIEILQFLAAQADVGIFPTYAQIGNAVHLLPEDRSEQLVPALDRLATGYGFIKRAWGMTSGKSAILMADNLSPEGIACGCEHTITNAGRRFLIAMEGQQLRTA